MNAHPVHGVGNGAGWYPKLSPDGRKLSPDGPVVAHGSGVLWLWWLETGEELRIRPDVRCQAAGWPDATHLLYVVGESPAELWSLDITTRQSTLVMGGLNISYASARDGTWASIYVGTGALVVNGTPLSLPGGRYIAASGDYVVIRTNEGLAVYHQGVRRPTVPFSTTCEWPSCDGTHAAYGYNGPIHLVDLTTGNQEDVTVAPGKAESAPCLIGDSQGRPWLWTSCERDTPGAIGRPLYEQACLVLPCDPPQAISAQLVGGRWVVVTQAAGDKNLTAQSIAADAPRVELPKPPEPPKPLPPLVRLDLSPLSGPVPLVVNAHLVPLAGSGQIDAVRYWKDGGREEAPVAADPSHAFNFDAEGPHSIFARAAVGSQAVDTPIQIVTALPAPPVIVVPPEPVFWRGLNAGNCTDQLSAEILPILAEKRVALIRRDGMNKLTDQASIDIVDAETWAVGIRPLYLGKVDMMQYLPRGAFFEYSNGAGGTAGIDGTTYGKEACRALEIAADRGITLFLGCYDNMTNGWFQSGSFHDRMVRALGNDRWKNAAFSLAVHWYPDGAARLADRGHDGRATKQADVDYFRRFTGGRKWLVTETGYTDATITTGWWIFKRKWSLTQQQVLDRMRWDDAFWNRQPDCLGVCWYQLTEVLPGVASDEHYGWSTPIATGGRIWKLQSNLWVKAA